MHDQFVGSVSCNPVDVNYTMPTDDPKQLLGNFLSSQICPVIHEMTDWDRHEALGGDSYGYYGDFDSPPGFSDYDDPRDYREWCDWSDVEEDDGCCSGGCSQVLRESCGFTEGPGLFDNMETGPGPESPEPGEVSHLPILSDIGGTDFKGPSLVFGDVPYPPVSV